MRVLKRSHGRAISKKWFLKKASQVDFTLPVTIRLLPAVGQGNPSPKQHNAQTILTAPSSGTSLTVQSATGFVNGQSLFVFAPGGSEDSATITGIAGNVITINAPLANVHPANDVVSSIPGGANQATLDLGPSLGVRSIGLGGYIPAQINFNDAFNGGQLGDVKLTIPSNVPSAVTTTSVPLLSNTNTTSQNAPENSIDSFIVSNSDPGSVSLAFTGFPGSTTGPVSVASIVGGSPPGGSLQAALVGVTNPITGSGTVGANGVYAYSAPFSASPPSPLAVPCPVGPIPQCSYVAVVFTGPKFNGTPMPSLTTGAGDTASYLVPPGQRVVGQQPGLDGNGQGGCNQFHGNGLATLGTPNDVDLLNNLNTSMDPGTGSFNNLGPGPSYGGSTNPQDTVLRTGPLTASVAAPGTVTIPADNQGDGITSGTGTTQYTIGPSGGKANLFGTAVNGLPAGDSLDVTVNLQTRVNDIARQVDGGFPGPSGAPDETKGNISAYANCRQAWTGGIQDYLTNLHLSGALRISPAITADGHLRIAKTYLHSTRPTTETLAACLSPYQLYMQGNPFALDAPFAGSPVGTPGIGPNLLGGNPAAFNPLVELVGAALGPAAAGYQGSAVPSSVAPTVGCDSGSGPLNRAPFNVTPLHGTSSTTSPTSSTDIQTSLNNGSAVAVSGALNVTNLQAEALVGNIAGG